MRRFPRAALVIALSLPVAARAATMKSAVQSGDGAAVAALLDQGADLNGTVGPADLTPLELAVNARKPEIAKLLLDRGADVNVRRNGTSALSLAAINGDLAMTDLLLARGAEAGKRELAWAQGPDRDAIVAHLTAAAGRQSAAAAAAAPAAAPALSDADRPSYKSGERPDDFALLVGVETYLDAPAARYAERDVEAVRAHLLAMGWPARNVLILTGARAGRAGLEKYLEKWLPNNVNENTRLFFYFAGDGASDPKTGAAYLLPYDGDAAMLEATGYPLSRLYASLAARKVRAAFALIDAGFSGAGERAASAGKGPAVKTDYVAREVGQALVLLAAGPGESAGILDAQKHGALTYFALKAFAGDGAGPGGAVTVKRVFEDLRPKVVRAAKEQGRTQTPQLLTGALGEADLRLR